MSNKILFAMLALWLAAVPKTTVLYDFEGDLDLEKIRQYVVKMYFVQADGGTALQINNDQGYDKWPIFTLHAPNKTWDLSRHTQVSVDIRNVGRHPVKVHSWIYDKDGKANYGFQQLNPDEKKVLTIKFDREIADKEKQLDFSALTSISIVMEHPHGQQNSIVVDNVRGEGAFKK